MDNELSLLHPPPATIELRALNDRWGEVVDWVLDASNLANENRRMGFYDAMKIQSLSLRWSEFFRVDQQYYTRLKEIESTEHVFKKAFEETKDSLNYEEILAYSVSIGPFIHARDQKLLKDRARQQIEAAHEKSRIFEERRKRTVAREAKKAGIGRLSGEVDRGNRDIPEANRAQAVADEGTGNRIISEDRGISSELGRNEDVSVSRGTEESSQEDDRIKPEISGLDSEGSPEQGL